MSLVDLFIGRGNLQFELITLESFVPLITHAETSSDELEGALNYNDMKKATSWVCVHMMRTMYRKFTHKTAFIQKYYTQMKRVEPSRA